MFPIGSREPGQSYIAKYELDDLYKTDIPNVYMLNMADDTSRISMSIVLGFDGTFSYNFEKVSEGSSSHYEFRFLNSTGDGSLEDVEQECVSIGDGEGNYKTDCGKDLATEI